MAQTVNLVKQVYGVNTYKNVVDTQFSELVVPTPVVPSSNISIDQFFIYYDQLFYDIPVSGSNGSHYELVQRSSQYIGGDTVSQREQALLDEINTLKEQIINLSQTYLSINNLTQ
jgi:hypothetical protein